MKVAILFPNNESSRNLCSKLLEAGSTVVFYCPDSFDLDIAQNIITEMNILGEEQNVLREEQNFFSVPSSHDLRDCQYIGKYVDLLFCHSQVQTKSKLSLVLFNQFCLVIPCLDVDASKSDKDYASMCSNLFQ